ncbi:polysaccharide deacetylase family protein [Kineosporiaceae bacterium B12]|nr:polysaccharide deacetylase family protein [Kineococcus rubinsiae]
MQAAAEQAGGASADDARLGAEVAAVWEVLAAADPEVTAQDALAVLADLRLRPSPAPVPAVAPARLAAWRPAGTAVPPRAERDAEAVAVADALAGGRLLRVVNFHDTPVSRRAELAAEFAWYAERFDPVSAADVHAFLDTGRWGSDRPGLVPAFYDGFASAARVAVPLCEEFGFTGWFYPPTEFLDVPADGQRAFAERHDYGVLDADPGGRLAMTWDELADLATRHEVCGHTATHAPSAAVASAAEVEREVLAPLARLREVTGRTPASWAWLGGTPHDPARPGDRAVAGAGVRLVTSNAALQRLG